MERSIGDNGSVFAGQNGNGRAAFVKTAPLRATQRHLPIKGRRGMRSDCDGDGGKTRPTFAFVIESIDSDDALPVRPVLPLASTPAEISLYTIWRNATARSIATAAQRNA
uniref:Uncharacterized protein n=1 Tax=Plectus sambesii TaxID=2011161 RepID=A0A914UKI2_9BILA